MTDSEKDLFDACKTGKRALLQQALQDPQLDINVRNEYGLTPFLQAVCSGHKEIVKILLKNIHVNPTLVTPSGNSALHLAVFNRHAEIAGILLKDSRIDPNLQNQSGETAFFGAVETLKLEIVETLLNDSRVDPNIGIPLFVAIERRGANIVKALLADGRTNPYIKNGNGETLLEYALKNPNKEVREVLLTDPRTAAHVQVSDELPALHLAAKNGEVDELRKLIKSGENPNLPFVSSNFQPVPIHQKGVFIYTPLLKLHSNLGTSEFGRLDPDFGHFGRGITPLHVAVRYGQLPVVKALLEHPDIDANLQTLDGFSPLQVAAQYCKEPSICSALYDSGKAIYHLSVPDRFSPLAIALSNQNEALIPVFQEIEDREEVCAQEGRASTPKPLQASANNSSRNPPLDRNAQNKHEETPLSVAEKNVHPTMAEQFPPFKLEKSQKSSILQFDKSSTLPPSQGDLSCINNNLFFRAVSNGNLSEVTNLIIKNHVDPTVYNDSQETALFVAARNNKVEVVDYLLRNNRVNPNAGNKFGETPLLVAAREGNLEVVRRLLKDKRVNPFLESQFKETALSAANENGYSTVAEELRQANLEKSEKLEESNELKQIYQLILEAIDANQKDTVELFLEEHAFYFKNIKADQLFKIAKEKGPKAVEHFLRECAFTQSVGNKRGKTNLLPQERRASNPEARTDKLTNRPPIHRSPSPPREQQRGIERLPN